MSNFYPTMHPVEEVWNGSTVTVGNPEIGHFSFDEANRVATTEGYVHPPQDPARLEAVAREAGCVVRVSEDVIVDLGRGLGEVLATPVTVETDSSKAPHLEVILPYPRNRNGELIRRHARGVVRFMGLVASKTAA